MQAPATQARDQVPLDGEADQAAEGSRRLVWLMALLIVLAGLAAYQNSFEGPYVFDDVTSIVTNPTLRHWWPPRGALTPPADATVSGRPVLNYTLAVNYAMGGLQVGGYHATNLAIHLLAGLTLFGLVRRTLRSAVLRESSGTAAEGIALVVTLVWTVHPLLTQAVSYLIQRAESLAGLFYLLTLYTLARALSSIRAKWWLTASVAACLLGMGTKEVVATAPVLALLYDRTFGAGSLREAWARRKGYYLALAATWIELGWLVMGTQGRTGTVGFGLLIPWWQYALTQLSAVAHYLALAIWPNPLVFDYGEKLMTGPGEIAVGAAVTGTLLAGTCWALWRRPTLGFLGAWFFLILAPSSSVVPIVSQTMAEYRMYLPLAAVITLAVILIHRGLGRPGLWLGGVAALALGWVTHERNAVYQSKLALAQDTVAKMPENPRALVCLGDAWLEAGNAREAMKAYGDALEMRPDYFLGHNGLGMALLSAGQTEAAVTEFKRALTLVPEEADTYYNLGQAYFAGNHVPEAIAAFRRAEQLDPESVDEHFSLGNALAKNGQPQEALKEYAMVLELEPTHARAQYSIGTILAQQGQWPEAILHFKAALSLDPDYALAWNNLGIALAQADRPAEAVEAFKQAVRIYPGNPELRSNLEQAQLKLKAAQH